MDRALIFLSLLAVAACDSPRRGGPIRIGGCVEGRTAPCTCAGGATGTQVCTAERTFGACECTETGEDAGFDPDRDAGFDEEDAGFRSDAGFPPDAGFPEEDTGVRTDAGFPFDSGAGDADTGPRDTGVATDSGVRDAGFPVSDGGFPIPDGGFPIPDGGIPLPDGGIGSLCGLVPELGLPCSTDGDCNTILPFGVLVCQNFRCVEGCLCENGPVCQSPAVCDPISGRCL